MDQTASLSSSAAANRPASENAPKRTADWFMFVFKVRPCYRSYPHNWSTCPYVHPGEKARRRDPRTHSYRPLPCPHDRQGGICPDGDACNYTHNVYEDWLHPLKFRTQMCQDVENCSRPLCFFAHSAEELRQPGQPLAQPQAQGQVPAGQGSSTVHMAPLASGAGLPPGVTVMDAAMMLARTGQPAGAGSSAAAGEAVQQDQMAVLAQFRQRHAAAAAAATTTALDSVFAGASGNAAAAMAGAPAGVAEADYVGTSGGFVMGQYGMLATPGQPALVLQASHGSSADAQWGGGTYINTPQAASLQAQQQQQQFLQMQQYHHQQQPSRSREWASAPLPGVGYAVLDGSSIYNTLPGGAHAPAQGVWNQVPQQQVQVQQPQQQQQQQQQQPQQQQLMYIGAGPHDVQWLGQQQQQQQQQHALAQQQQQHALAQQQQLQLSHAYQQQLQQPQQQQAAGMPMLPMQLVPAAATGTPVYGSAGAGVPTFRELQASQNFSGPQFLGSVPAAGGGSMPVYGTLQALQQQQLQAAAPTGSRSAPLLRLTAGWPGQDSAGTSSGNTAGMSSDMRLELLQAALR